MNLIFVVIVLAALLFLMWLLYTAKGMSFKVFAMILIFLILSGTLSVIYVFHEKTVDLESPSGIYSAIGVYFSWLGNVFSNFMALTGHAIRMDWEGNQTT